MSNHAAASFVPLNIAILTVSDSRSLATDSSGQYLVDAVTEAGHRLAERALAKDDRYALRAIVSRWIASEQVQAVIVTGGTGFSARDTTPESLRVLFDKEIEGFGELFRHVSHGEIGSSTIQSRAFAGLANGVVIFCLPGSTGACRTGWTAIIRDQLDASHRPCNFVAQLKVVDSQVAPCPSRA